jgi:Putative abortive phage resistance protein AbiGi, antitoxin
MTNSPGTVSKILWHFTGGPKWNEVEKCQEHHPKPSPDAYAAILSILGSKVLRLGGYEERAVFDYQKPTRTDRLRGVVETETATADLASRKVCCLADIPAVHLSYHAQRYGRFAIGFHREAVMRHGFNPVLYTPRSADVLRSVFSIFSTVERLHLDDVFGELLASAKKLEESGCSKNYPVADELVNSLKNLACRASFMSSMVYMVNDSLNYLLAFIKTFKGDELYTIYTEREWRSVKPFPFKWEDVAMIVLPRTGDDLKNTDYFHNFVEKQVVALGVPRSVPIVPWEDLIEH